MTATPARFAVAANADVLIDRIARGQNSSVPDASVEGLTVNVEASSWPEMYGTTRELSDADDVTTLIRMAWEDGLLTGPTQPHTTVEEDCDGATVVHYVDRGTYPARVRLATTFLGWNETADVDARGTAWALSVLEHVVMHLNAVLTEHDNYVASLRTAA